MKYLLDWNDDDWAKIKIIAKKKKVSIKSLITQNFDRLIQEDDDKESK